MKTPALPTPRGDLTDKLLRSLADDGALPVGTAPSSPEDGALALWTAYALHHHGFTGVDDRREWDPDLMRIRRDLEDELEERLRRDFAPATPSTNETGDGDLADVLFAMAGDGSSEERSLARHVQTRATREQVLELVRWRSLFHLQEFDPTLWVVPRLPVRAKAALAELAYDEYGAGDPNRLHHHLFERGMAECGLDTTPGAYADEAPAELLDQNNAMSLFGLQRRLRGAAVGHFAAFEATSSAPSRRLAQGMARLEMGEAFVDYYDTHVEADAVHEQVAVRTICGSVVEDDPALRDDVILGAAVCLGLEDRVGALLLDRWGVE